MDRAELENLFDALFPLTRSITGEGLRKSLQLMAEAAPFTLLEYPTGMKCFDWEVPDEWNVRDAFVQTLDGRRIIDYKENNLHLMGYSVPFFGRIAREELLKHLHYIEEKPDAVPFVTSYYKRRWGFSIPFSLLADLTDDEYDVFVDTDLAPGSLTAAEGFVKGRSKKEVLLFSHAGHPSMANDQLSGPLAVTAVLQWLNERQGSLKYSYRAVLAPETIGSISYIYNNRRRLKRHVIGGFTAACVADPGGFNYRKSKGALSPADRGMINVLKNQEEPFTLHEFSPLGCDERHFNSPGIQVPLGSIMRSMPGHYPEYHTSLDNKEFISFEALHKSIELMKKAILNIEADARVFHRHKNCEPKLDKHGLYPDLSNKNNNQKEASLLISLWAGADGRLLSEIADELGVLTGELRRLADLLAAKKIITIREI